EDFQDDKTLTFSTNFKTKIESNIDLIIAATYQQTESENYREVADLLGGQYFANVDDFADAGQSGQFDANNPDRKIYEGDRYEYDYVINRDYADLFIQTQANWNWLTWTFGATVSRTSFYRDGKYRHYLYMDDSYGKSKTYEFWNFGAKTNFLFKLNGRNFIALNGQYSTNAPTSEEVFANARSNSLAVPDLKNAQIMAGELSYIYRAPRVKAKATGYYTLAKDEMEKSFGFIDNEENTYFAAEVLNNVDKQYFGTELAIEAQVTTAITVSAVASIGQFTYNNTPDYYLFSDDLTN